MRVNTATFYFPVQALRVNAQVLVNVLCGWQIPLNEANLKVIKAKHFCLLQKSEKGVSYEREPWFL